MSRIWLAVILMVLVDSSGALCISKGMKQVGEISTLQPRKLWGIVLHRILPNHMLWLGFLLQASTFFLFLTLLSWANLSVVVPMAAIGYLVSILGAKLFLKENITKERWIGTLFICVGVILVSLHSNAR